jgi:hypothetical protein
MSDRSHLPLTTRPRRWFPRFGMRTVFALIGLAALAAWWVRGEMNKEQLREDLIADLSRNEAIGLQFDSPSRIPWRRRWLAWLRGKPAGPELDSAQMNEIEVAKLQEFAENFPEASVYLEITRKENVPKLLSVLARVKNLISVNLPSIEADDETLAGLGKIRPKHALCFGAKRVDDELLRKAADANIDVGWIFDHEQKGWRNGWERVTNEGLRAAARFPKLITLSAGRNASDDGVAAFNAHPTVYTVELTGPGYTDVSAETLATIPNLRRLTLSETKLTDAGIAKAIGSHPIESLTLSKSQLGAESIAAIAKLTKLRQLDLEDAPLSPELIAALATLPIDYLSVRGDYSDSDLAQLAPLAPALTTIKLHTPNVTDAGLKWLSGAVNVSGLYLSDTQATAETIKIIATNNPPVLLELGGPNIDATFLAEAQHKFRVGSVSLSGDSINDATLAAVESNNITLAGTRVTAKGLRAIQSNGREVQVVIWYAENTQPPLTPQEIEEIKSETGGLVQVWQHAITPQVFERLLPRSSRKPPVKAETP